MYTFTYMKYSLQEQNVKQNKTCMKMLYTYKHELCSNSKLDTNHANRTRKTFRGLESSTTVLTLLCTGIKLLKETSSNVCKYQIKYFIFFYLSLGVNSGKSTFNLDLLYQLKYSNFTFNLTKILFVQIKR